MTNLDLRTQLKLPIHAQDHYQGSKEARLTLVEYGDYACPRCIQVYPLLQSIQAQFSDLCFIFRYFPCLDRHSFAQHAAEAAEAAAAQGKFWEMHDRLMCQGKPPDDASLIEHAIALRLDVNRFLHEMSTDVHVARVLSDYNSGIESRVNCTPTFFINGFQFTGDWKQSGLQTTIEQLL